MTHPSTPFTASTLLAAGALLVVPACLPHSAVVGQTAAPLASGATEVGVSVGISHTNTVTDEVGNEDNLAQTQAPAVESNILHALSDKVGLNLHASSAGLQPGLKISLVQGPVDVAVLPAFGIGYFRLADDDTGNGGSDAFGGLTIVAGGRVLVSSDAGAYGALGYDFQRTRLDDPDDGEGSMTYTFHNVTGALGYDVDLGHGLHVRPEVAVLYAPTGMIAEDSGTPGAPANEADASSWTLFPNLTLAVSTN